MDRCLAHAVEQPLSSGSYERRAQLSRFGRTHTGRFDWTRAQKTVDSGLLLGECERRLVLCRSSALSEEGPQRIYVRREEPLVRLSISCFAVSGHIFDSSSPGGEAVVHSANDRGAVVWPNQTCGSVGHLGPF
jgi:hypothetical protein